MPEFTGERVVPGLVDTDLFNEHMARYHFAARLAAGKRVLDAGCGAGYGSAELARFAGSVLAIDLSEDAISYAREKFHAPNLAFETGNCLSLPAGPFDLIVAFEVIEHLQQWASFLAEAKRALAPGGMFLVSTPNKLYYAESRGGAGENPFHVHEFEFEEFRAALKMNFPHVEMLLQNHAEAVAFSNPGSEVFDSRIDGSGATPDQAHFFLAACSLEPAVALSGFVWVPGTGNVLREREHHISLLIDEVAMKTAWLRRSKEELDSRNGEYEKLLETVRSLNAQVEERNRWAIAMREETGRLGKVITELQEERTREQENFAATAAGYEAKIAELEEVNRAKTEWAIETERRLTEDLEGRMEALAKCVDVLHQTEEDVEAKTLWARSLESELNTTQLELIATRERLVRLRSYRWINLGVKLKALPERD